MTILVGTGQITITDVNDSYNAGLSLPSITLPASSAGSVSSYVGAEAYFKITLGSTDVTALFSYYISATGGGISYRGTGDSSDRTGTGTTSGAITTTGYVKIVSLTQDSSYLDITATKVGEQDITRRFTVTRAKAGAPTYTWFAWASDIVGTGISTTAGTLAYIGVASNKTTATAPSLVYTDYTWSKIVGADAITIDLLSPTDIFPTANDGTGFSGTSIPNNTIRVYKGGVLQTATSYGCGATAGTQTQTVSGIIASVTSTSPTITFSGTWDTNNTAVFTFNAVYSTQTYTTTYSIAKGKMGAVSTVPGLTGKGTYRAYKATTNNTTTPSIPANSTAGSAPDNGAFETSTGTAWALSPTGLVDSTNTTQWQSDGTSAAGSITVVWTTPYLSYFKVANLSAITANIGTFSSGSPGSNRTIIKDSMILVVDNTNKIRVRIGDLSTTVNTTFI
jgi:hypothetical protein